jgi:hypothetical protein
MYNCYFCQKLVKYEELSRWNVSAGSKIDWHHRHCHGCAQKHQLESVTMTFIKSQSIRYAHINTLNGYHYRLEFQENKTILELKNRGPAIVELSGFPITPANANNKLKTLLTFS